MTHKNQGVLVTAVALLAMAPNFEVSVKQWLQSPRFMILPATPHELPYDKIQTPPPPGKPETAYDIRVV